jgi:hypothetical protein
MEKNLSHPSGGPDIDRTLRLWATLSPGLQRAGRQPGRRLQANAAAEARPDSVDPLPRTGYQEVPRAFDEESRRDRRSSYLNAGGGCDV